MVFVTAARAGDGLGRSPGRRRYRTRGRSLDRRHRDHAVPLRGHEARSQAEAGVHALREACDTVVVIPNERLLEVLDKNTSMLDAFKIADDAAAGRAGNLRLDHRAWADQRRLCRRPDDHAGRGHALMGIGFATGENRAVEAAERALRSPRSWTRSSSVRRGSCSIAGGNDLSLYEVNEAAEVIRAASTDDEHHLRRDRGRATRRAGLGDGGRDRRGTAGRIATVRATPGAVADAIGRPARAALVPPELIAAPKGAIAVERRDGGGQLVLADGGNAVDACLAAAFVSVGRGEHTHRPRRRRFPARPP